MSGEEDVDDCLGDRESCKDLVFIDLFFIMDQFKVVERMNVGKLNVKDIVDVIVVVEVILFKGSVWVIILVKFNVLFLLYGVFRDYQKIGLDWLVKFYRKNFNGILVDEVGLGKIVQIIVFFVYLVCNEGNWGFYFVVVRSCNIFKWEFELKCWCFGFKIFLYIGSYREFKVKRQEWVEFNSFYVCIMFYMQFFWGFIVFI